MTTVARCAALFALVLPVLAGCNWPGRPDSGPEVPRPEQITSFDALYGSNCAGCHGAKGENGAAANLANPEFQALLDNATLRDIIVNGEKDTMMPAFSVKRGGTLTDAQIDALIAGMRARWGKGNALSGLNAPPYKATRTGDTTHGAGVYTAACARCHGTLTKPGDSGSILDGSFLAVISEQTMRTTVIAGRPDLGMPDWRGLVRTTGDQTRPLTDTELTDLTAWIMSQKPTMPGQPYAQKN